MKPLSLRNALIDQVGDVDHYARHVLLVFQRFADGTTAVTWCSQQTIAKLSGISLRRVRTAVEDLERAHHIVVVGQRKVPRGHIPMYRINVPTTGTPCRQSNADHRHGVPVVELRPPAPHVATTGTTRQRPPARRAADLIKEIRLENRSPSARERASGVGARASSFGESEQTLVACWADAIEKHRGARPVVRDEELRAARKLLKSHDVANATALIEQAVALSVAARVKGNASLIAIAADPAAFIGKAPTPKASAVKQHAPSNRPAWMNEVDS